MARAAFKADGGIQPAVDFQEWQSWPLGERDPLRIVGVRLLGGAVAPGAGIVSPGNTGDGREVLWHLACQLQSESTAVGHSCCIDPGGIHRVGGAEPIQQIAHELHILPVRGFRIGGSLPCLVLAFRVHHDGPVPAVFAPGLAQPGVCGHRFRFFLVPMECQHHGRGFSLRCGLRDLHIGGPALPVGIHPDVAAGSWFWGILQWHLSVGASGHGHDVGLFGFRYARDGIFCGFRGFSWLQGFLGTDCFWPASSHLYARADVPGRYYQYRCQTHSDSSPPPELLWCGLGTVFHIVDPTSRTSRVNTRFPRWVP